MIHSSSNNRLAQVYISVLTFQLALSLFRDSGETKSKGRRSDGRIHSTASHSHVAAAIACRFSNGNYLLGDDASLDTHRCFFLGSSCFE